MATKEKKLLSYIESQITSYAKQKTLETLGDRSEYIGASDIGGCPYKTVMSKRNPPVNSLQQELIFFRGHIAEEFVSSGLQGQKFDSQYEIVSELNGFPLKAHVDFIVHGKERKVIVEAKSTSAPLDFPYESWVMQVIFQMGLEFEKTGQMPDGYIVALDVNSGWMDEFPIEFSDSIFNTCLNKADHIISALRGECEPKAIVQYYCNTCPFKMSCPKQGQFAEDLPSELADDLDFIKMSKKMAKESKKREARVKEYMVNMEIESLREDTTQSVVTNREMQNTRVDTDRLKSYYPDIYKECSKQSSYFRMNIL